VTLVAVSAGRKAAAGFSNGCTSILVGQHFVINLVFQFKLKPVGNINSIKRNSIHKLKHIYLLHLAEVSINYEPRRQLSSYYRYCTVYIENICFKMNIHIDGKILPLLIANPYIIGNNTQKSKVKSKVSFSSTSVSLLLIAKTIERGYIYDG